MLTYKNVLVPVDFKEGSESAILKAASHSEASGSHLLVAHVIDNEVVQQKVLDVTAIERKLDMLLDSLEIGYCDKLVVVGNTVESLLDIIDTHDVDLVVMGTGVKEEPSRLVRSITFAVATKTACDVLVLHK